MDEWASGIHANIAEVNAFKFVYAMANEINIYITNEREWRRESKNGKKRWRTTNGKKSKRFVKGMRPRNRGM